VKVATWNVNGIRTRLEQLAQWTKAAAPDVLCLQETKIVDEDFPHAEIEAMGYPHRLVHGQKGYNGVAILSKLPLVDPSFGFLDGDADPQARIVRATVGGVRIVGCYAPNGNPLGTDKYVYKLRWYARLTAELAAHEQPGGDVLLCGDLNIAPDEADVFDPFVADGQVLFTKPEREAFRELLAFGFVDAWRKKNPFATAYSWWDYRDGGFRKNHGFRIDHVLLTTPLMRRCTSVVIDRTPRTWPQCSDHAPVVATLRDA
jgi:exodeoxyribonuclease-3